MTGWGFKPNKQKLPTGDVFFDQNKHQPGRKKVLGRYYREGKNAIFKVMKDLSNHPDCRKNIATKLCKHQIEPPHGNFFTLLTQVHRTKIAAYKRASHYFHS